MMMRNRSKKMRFRPCIDIHNGSVKQIVGGSLSDKGDSADNNFISEKGGAYYASLYKEHSLYGGHIIILNPESSPYYKKDLDVAFDALDAYPNGLQIGGGINDSNAKLFLDRGASHVIVTSFVFKNGIINYDNLKKLNDAVGKSRLVLDLSCRKREGRYYIVTDRWQKFTDTVLDESVMEKLSSYCDEFLIHAVDVEGRSNGIEPDVARLIGSTDILPVTYAGGIHSFEDIEALRELSSGRADFTIGSSLDIFGGDMSFEKVCSVSL